MFTGARSTLESSVWASLGPAPNGLAAPSRAHRTTYIKAA